METLSNSELVRNGFLVVQSLLDGQVYQGVSGYIWPLNDTSYKHLGISYKIRNSVEVATDWIATYRYWRNCRDKNINARLLLLETVIAHPKIDFPLSASWEYIGYDLSYVEGDFYSAIDQEILKKNSPFQDWQKKINTTGLFTTYKDASDFLKFRQHVVSKNIETYGELYAIRVFRYNPD